MQDRVHRGPQCRSRRMPLVAAVFASAILVTGCGGSAPSRTASTTASRRTYGSSASSGSGSHLTSPTQTFSKCMRADGVPNFPDLSSNGMRIAANGQTISINGVSINVPAFTAARQKCEKYMPHTGGTPTPAQSAQQQQQDLRFARCMRSHGIPNFPDPNTSSSGGAQTVHLGGINLSGPAFQAAAKKCGGFNPKGP
jgi:hypothetical protein